MRSRLIALVSTVFVLSACGGSNGAITIGSTAAESSSGVVADLCESLESDDGPTEELIASLPEDQAAAAEAVNEFAEAMDSMGDNDDTSIDVLTSALTKDGLADQLADLATFAEEECGTSQGVDAIAGLAVASSMASEPQDDEYCDALTSSFAGESDGGPDQFLALSDIAPESHRDPLVVLAEIDPETATDADQAGAFGPLFGLGIYAESVCGIDQAFSQVLLGAMFMGMGDGGTSSTTLPSGVDPAQYPDITADAANAAAPAEGGVTFIVTSVDLEDDGEYLASAVVPSDWESSTGFNVEFSPPEGSALSIFTTLEFGAGCDGSCEANDWEARLRGPDGYLTSYLDQHPSAGEAPIAGSEGVVVTDTAEVTALVLRWDDGADRYFSCQVDLEPEQASLLGAFVAACESSRPAWFAVG